MQFEKTRRDAADFFACNVRAFLLLLTGVCLLLANSLAAYWCAVGILLLVLGITFSRAALRRGGTERIVGFVSGIALAGAGGIVNSFWIVLMRTN